MSLIERIVAACCRHAVFVVFAALGLALIAGFYTARNFNIDTNSEKLVSANTDWRQREIKYDQLFPQQNNLILVVVDGATPERAEYGAAVLAARLSQHKDLLPNVRRPDGGEFFDRNGMLFLSPEDVQSTTTQLIQAQPFLGVLAADPSLRGIMDALGMMLQGVAQGQAKLSQIAQPIDAISKSLDDAAHGKRTFLAWRSLVTGAKPRIEEIRRFIEVQPKLDYGALEPGETASNLIRSEAASLHLTPDEGVRVRLTGPIPLADEEFGTLAERAGLMGFAMLAAVLITLWLAVRSVRIIAAILVTLIVGLILTTGVGIAYAHVFNIISIAFIALFVGLGVDFAIQFSVRYRSERHSSNDLARALALAGNRVGLSLGLAAAATAAGFLSFLPTNYSGVAELGVISGVGMLIAFFLSITLLPSLLLLLEAPSEPEQVGYRSLRPVDAYIRKHRRGVLRGSGVVALVAIALVPFLKFDFNPLDLRSKKVESVSTLHDLMKNPETSPDTINVLAPSLAKTNALVERLSHVPEVGQVLTLKSFVPDDQPKKLALIRDAQSLLDTTINPFGIKPPPSDGDVVMAMRGTAAALRSAAEADQTGTKDAAIRLAGTLEVLSGASPVERAIATDALVPGMDIMLKEVRDALTPSLVTLANLPADLKSDWIAKDGTARIEVYPKNEAFTNDALASFSNAVKAVAPSATGTPISIQDYGKTILRAFIQAGLISAIVITVILLFALRRPRDVLFTLAPLLLSALLTLASCVVLHLHLNFANVIALPLLLGVGVAFDIYFIIAFRNGSRNLLSSSLTRAVIFSALTTGSGFGSLWLSSHPGTASMGELLMISLGWTLITTLFFLPALLEQDELAMAAEAVSSPAVRR
jgi:hopanoid biosynthesis associated RND transporter like protein HpnN